MTEQQKRFADEYLKHLNGTKAYKAAYGEDISDNVASTSASRLLRNVKVKSYLNKRIEDRIKRTEITQDMVVMELFKMAFADVTDYVNIDYNKDGRPIVKYKPTEELTEDKTKAIKDINIDRGNINIEIHDKIKALELLGKHLGMWNNNLNMNVTQEDKVGDKIDELLSSVNEDDS